MADIKYTPQFKAPGWRDNVDLVLAEGPNGFNTQFENLRRELEALSGVVNQLNAALNTLRADVNTAQQAANKAQQAANKAQTAADNAQTAADNAQTTANTAQTTANTTSGTLNTLSQTVTTVKNAADTANKAIGSIIRGSVRGSDGVVMRGTGFNSRKVKEVDGKNDRVGLYEIQFNNPFKSIPSVVACQVYPNKLKDKDYDGSPADNVVVVGVDETRCVIKTGNGIEWMNRDFDFIAYGER